MFLFPEANKEKILNNSNVDLDDSLPSDTSDTQTDTTNHQGDGDSTSVTDLLPERRSGDVEMGDLGAPSSRSRTSSDCSLEGVARGVGGDAEGGYSRIRNEDTISCSSEYSTKTVYSVKFRVLQILLYFAKIAKSKCF